MLFINVMSFNDSRASLLRKIHRTLNKIPRTLNYGPTANSRVPQQMRKLTGNYSPLLMVERG